MEHRPWEAVLLRLLFPHCYLACTPHRERVCAHNFGCAQSRRWWEPIIPMKLGVTLCESRRGDIVPLLCPFLQSESPSHGLFTPAAPSFLPSHPPACGGWKWLCRRGGAVCETERQKVGWTARQAKSEYK
eukprot:3254337-Rhodomonas_salina.5